MLEHAYAAGARAALDSYKLAAGMKPTVPTTGIKPAPTMIGGDQAQSLAAPTHPKILSDTFQVQESGKTKLAPPLKVAEELCTTCRREKHYGPCVKPSRTPPSGSPLKRADFNLGMHGDHRDSCQDSDGPSTSPNYHSATSADSALARARDGRPAEEQAATAFHHVGLVNQLPDQANHMSGALNKVAEPFAPGAIYENRGPSTNPYDEREQRMSPPVGRGPVADQAIEQMFRGFDTQPDATSIEGNSAPASGPSVLG